MRVSAQEKEEIIRLVDRSELGVNKTLKELGIHKSTFLQLVPGLPEKGQLRTYASAQNPPAMELKVSEEQKQLVVEVALKHPVLSPRELAVKLTDEQRVFILESSVYRILKANGLVTT